MNAGVSQSKHKSEQGSGWIMHKLDETEGYTSTKYKWWAMKTTD